MEKIDHILIPEHKKLSKEEAEQVLKKYNISKKQLPRILKKDKAVEHLDVKKGDVIEITRDSQTAGKSIFYRVVI